MQEPRPDKGLRRSMMLVRAMHRGFAESKWRRATAPSSSASSNIVIDLAGLAARCFKSTECSVNCSQRDRA
jgi:hypothetical protein